MADPAPIETSDGFAVTAMQMAMLYESNGSYLPWVNIEQMVLRFDAGFPDTDRLRRAWATCVARYDALRSVIQWQNVQRPVQHVLDVVDVKVDAQDWSAISEETQGHRLSDFLQEDRNRGIDLQAVVGWRIAAFRTGPATGVLVLTAHHAVLDGRSMAIVLADLLHFLDQKTAPQGAAKAVSFQSVATALTTPLVDESAARGYFADYLEGFETIGTLSLPGTREGSTKAERPQNLVACLTDEVTQSLVGKARDCDATVANLVQAAWGLVLARWQGREEVAIGAVRSGRHAVANSGDTVGCLINTLPLRVSLSKDKSLKQLVQGLRRDTKAMHPFEQTSPSELRNWGGLAGHQPLFCSVVMFERGPMEALVYDHYDGLLSPTITLHEEGGQPLTLAVYGATELELVLEFDPGKVSPFTASAMHHHLCQLLSSMATAAPDTLLGDLEMMQPGERADLIALGQPDDPITTAQPDVLERFYTALKQGPNRTAILPLSDTKPAKPAGQISERLGALCYDELDQRANGLAWVLRDRGIGAGDVVAISLDRSAEFIVSMFAALKLGAAFVPVDPTYPPSNQRHMMEDSGAKIVIARHTLGDAQVGMSFIRPNAEPVAQAPDVQRIDPETRAYIIYTSGSTGVPKGVAVTRANLASHVAALSPALGLSAQDRVLQFASLSFDVALEEVFPTLLAGATLILRDDAMAQSPAAFFDALAREEITVANLPTAFWTVLTEYLVEQGRFVPECLRLAIVGGELVKPNTLQQWQHVAPDTRWMNGYGPTEATITSTLFEATGPNTGEEVPIGRPTSHASTYIVAADGSLAPRGVEGELAIGGAAVAQGYIGRPRQTADSFRTDNFKGSGRLYFSGDRAKWSRENQLRFLGRRDRQLKLRGFRIDLRDVERAMEDVLPGSQAIVGVVNRDQPTARLVAWVKPKGTPDRVAVGQSLRYMLPAHMRPEIVWVEAFPITAGGKVDQKALPAPTEVASTVVPLSKGGETVLERTVQTAMARVLGRKSVGVNDDFYDLGGHSLMAVELLGRLETQTGRQLGIVDLKENPTSRGLARILETGSSAPKHIVPIQPNGDRPPLFAVHVLGKDECYFRPLARHLGPGQPILGVSVGALDENTPTGIEFTARRYCLDIMEYYPEGPINIMSVSLGSYVAFEMARQFRAAGREVAFFGMFDAAGPDGRHEATGLARLRAHLRQARHLGLVLPYHVLSRRFENLRYALARRRAKTAAARGAGHAPTSVSKLVALNELAVASYEPRPIDVPLTIFRAQENFFDSTVGIETGLGWASVAEQGFDVVDVPGGHLSMLEDPNVASLALHFADVLAAQQRDQLERTRKRLLAHSENNPQAEQS